MQNQDDPYSDGASATEPATPNGDAPADSADNEGAETAVLPTSLCPGMKPGDEIKLRIVSVDDDSYQVEYEKKGAAEPASERATAPQSASDSDYQ